MFSIDVESGEDEVDVCLEDIIMNIATFNKEELIELKGEIEYELNNDVSFPALEGDDSTLENNEKLKFLIDNIWNISLTDLENLKK